MDLLKGSAKNSTVAFYENHCARFIMVTNICSTVFIVIFMRALQVLIVHSDFDVEATIPGYYQ